MREAVDAMGAWMTRHEQAADLVTVWALVIGFAVFALVKLASWWAIRNTRDRTGVGVALKRQKLAEVVLGVGMAVLYSLTLWAYYAIPSDVPIGVWERMGLRLAVFLGIAGAAVFGGVFAVALWRERGGVVNWRWVAYRVAACAVGVAVLYAVFLGFRTIR